MTKKLLLLSVFAVLATATANAQERFRLKVTVPFSFYVGQSAMAAGEYEVRTHSASNHVLIFYSADTKSVATTFITPALKMDRQEKGKLIFNRYGSEYFLAEVWNANSNGGGEIKKTRRELEVAAAGSPNPQTAALYAKSR